ncbi:MAG TPA: hypothetical protein VFG14_06800, partial [Chthoniobacteraceae bacterium]|nr:hypothetical protein [Chthoniobacteraceae bacterium]
GAAIARAYHPTADAYRPTAVAYRSIATVYYDVATIGQPHLWSETHSLRPFGGNSPGLPAGIPQSPL